MKVMILTILLSCFITDFSFAKEKKLKPKEVTKTEKVEAKKLVAKVKGMVCAFCAQGIEKNFNEKKSVKATKVNLDSMTVEIELKPGKTLEEKIIKSIIVDAGFDYGGLIEK